MEISGSFLRFVRNVEDLIIGNRTPARIAAKILIVLSYFLQQDLEKISMTDNL